MQTTLNIIVRGKVQGVFYRQSTKTKAETLNITGVVKNNKDGSVSIIATGDETTLHQLAEWCKTGPPRALVSEIIITNMALTNFNDFQIIR